MSAQEAREMAKAANTSNIDEVYGAIEEFARKGDYRMHIYTLLKPEQRQQLIENGFKVDDVSDRNETCIEISWLPEKEEAPDYLKLSNDQE